MFIILFQISTGWRSR